MFSFGLMMGCKKGSVQQATESETPESVLATVENAKEAEFTKKIVQQVSKFETPDSILTTIENVKESEFTMMNFFEELDQKLFNLKSDHARIFSIRINDPQPVIVVVFNEENPLANVQVFLDIINESGEDLAKKYKGGTLIAYTTDFEHVMSYYGGTADQIFILEGIHFYDNKNEVSETENSVYKNAYIEIVKKKRNKTKLTDWDHYMFRNRLPEPEKKDNKQAGPAVLGSSALIEVLCVEWDLIERMGVASSNVKESFLKIPEERESAKTVMEKAVYGIVWFNIDDGRRIMAETLSTDEKTGKIIKERRWYNGYSGPK
jgi:hypothetical protein